MWLFAVGFIIGWFTGSRNEIKKHIKELKAIRDGLLMMRDQVRQG
jgi:hypothetical protein